MHVEGLLSANFWLVTLLSSEQCSQFGTFRHIRALGVAVTYYVSSSCSLHLEHPPQRRLLMKSPAEYMIQTR